jgi:Putative Actinobacterial Holin-X, holin superfamily III
VNPGVSTREPTVPQLLTGLMQDAQQLLRQEVALATHELRRELRTTLRAVMSLGISIGIAAIGGWLLILMLVHLLQALTALPLWACDGIVGGLLAAGGIGLLVLGTQKLAQLHLVPQDTVDTMKENVQWLTEQVRPNSRATRDRPR